MSVKRDVPIQHLIRHAVSRRLYEASARRVDPPHSCTLSRRMVMQETRDLSAAASGVGHCYARGIESGQVWRDPAWHKIGYEEKAITRRTTTPV